ncbi:hypothetical protein GCM10007919_38090 [Rhizobium indigoferae]|nr:hypothetical protein GCM10007919_38090 [Rhizobium indigoferae]
MLSGSYFRFNLSLRDVEEMLLDFGIVVSSETIRRWWRKHGLDYARRIRRKAPTKGDVWHLDDVVVRINGQKCWLWRAVDQDGYVLDEIVQTRRNTQAAKRLLTRLLKKHGLPEKRRLGLTWPHSNNVTTPAGFNVEVGEAFDPGGPDRRDSSERFNQLCLEVSGIFHDGALVLPIHPVGYRGMEAATQQGPYGVTAKVVARWVEWFLCGGPADMGDCSPRRRRAHAGRRSGPAKKSRRAPTKRK